MMSLWDALRMNMMISYQELVRTFPKSNFKKVIAYIIIHFVSLMFFSNCFHELN
ncbi:Uncharacterised protein [Klebsiella pneumoniae]|nr:Uncharacterised protein [Klebsiella pneumoniae]